MTHPQDPPPLAPGSSPRGTHELARVIAVGAGTHGADALVAFFTPLHAIGDAAFVVTAHRDGADEHRLAAQLQAASRLVVVVGRDGEPLVRGQVHVVAPGATVQPIAAQVILRGGGDAHAPIDRLMRSVAACHGKAAIGVVLSGAGADGTLGLKLIKEAGGVTMAQAPADAAHGAMPRSAIATGLVDVVSPAAELARRVLELLAEPDEPRSIVAEPEPERSPLGADPDEDLATNSALLQELLELVRRHTGHDFTPYRRATLRRRLARRMQLTRTPTLEAYRAHVQEHPQELNKLLRDFLVSVTSFFRDREVFHALARTVFPRLFAHKHATDHLRIWVPGCATGEEAYSLAMVAAEHAAQLREPPQIQVFATDLDEEALAEARTGRYPETIAADVSGERLARFFTRDGAFYRVRRDLRELVLFSAHNVLRDPPFSRLDLVSCRNLLIYLQRDAQDRLLSTFHFALRSDGVLLLGSSESAEGEAARFGVIDGPHRIFDRRTVLAAPRHQSTPSAARWTPPIPRPAPGVRVSPFGELHHRVVERYGPPSLLVNHDLEVVHLSEHAGRYLVVGGGEPTRNLLRMIRPDLRLDLRAAVFAARQGNGVDVRPVRLETDGAARSIELTVRVVELPPHRESFLLVSFDEQAGPAPASAPDPRAVAGIEPVVQQLEEELHQTRELLRSTAEQNETSVEELEASNEELQAINEELRSATEELETSKEELQAANEELSTLNRELKERIDEISHANADLGNLIASTDLAVVFLDAALNVKRFTPRARDLFNVIDTDVGRPLDHLTHRLVYPALMSDAALVVLQGQPHEREVRGVAGGIFLARLSPYRGSDGAADGVVLTFLDVTDLRASEQRFHLALRTAPLIMFTQDTELRFTWAYVDGREVDLAGRTDHDVFAPAEADALAAVKREVMATGTSRRRDLRLTLAGVTRDYDVNIEPTTAAAGVPGGTACAAFDVTGRKATEELLREADRRKDEFLATLVHELRNPLAPLRAALELQRRAGDDRARSEAARAIMERQVDQIARLVDDLLDVSRVTLGKIELVRTPVVLSELIAAAVEIVQPMIDAAGHALAVSLPSEPIVLEGDRVRLVQVLSNVLGNAARYTPGPGHLGIAGIREADGRIVIRVRDDGIGIEPALLPRVFEQFLQGDHARHGGLGLGLTLVRRLVELHGGQVQAHSDGPGRGTEIVVTLPAGPETAAAIPAAAPAPATRRHQRTVLVVDDDADITSTTAELLRLEGYRVETAGDAATALARIDAVRPDVIVLDLGLPGMSGHELARTVRRRADGAGFTIVAVSGWGQPHDLTRSREVGIDHHLVKPVELTALIAAFESPAP